MRSLGIDIGRHSLKVVEITASNRSYQITGAKVYPFNLKSNDLEIEILQALKEVEKDFEAETARVVTSIRQQYVSLRRLSFPFREKAKIHKSLGFELEDEIPLSIEKTVFDAKILHFNEKMTEVIAAACPIDEVQKTIDLFNRCHIDPDILTPEYAAIANLYGRWHAPPTQIDLEEPTKDKMVVFFGHTKTFVGSLRNNQLIWSRSLLWGSEKIAQNIARSFHVPMTESIKMMPDKAFILLTSDGANDDQIKMSHTVTEAFKPFIDSLRLSIMLSDTQHGTNIAQIELVGGPSQIKNIGPFFTKYLEKPTNSVNPLNNFDDGQVKPLVPFKDICHFAFGLALEGIKRPINPPMNLRQAGMAKKNRSFDIFWEKWNYTAKLLAIAYFCYFIYGVTRESIAINLEEKSNDVLMDQAAKIAKLKGGAATQSRIRSYIKKNKKKAKTVKLFKELSNINSPVKWINDISQTFPPNKNGTSYYEVRRLKVTGDVVTLQGLAKNQKVITDLESALKRLAKGGKVKTIPSQVVAAPEKKKFAFQFNIPRKN